MEAGGGNGDYTPQLLDRESRSTGTMRALVFHGPNEIAIENVPILRERCRRSGRIRVTLTTICGTDIHIVKGEYKVRPGLVIGHEPVGVIQELGEGVIGYKVGDRVLVGAITPCGQCGSCLSGQWSQCGGPIGGWKFGNTSSRRTGGISTCAKRASEPGKDSK